MTCSSHGMWSQLLDKTEVGNTSSIVLSSLEMTCYSGEECLQHKLGFSYPSSLYGCGPLVERTKCYSNIFGCILTRNIMDMYVSCQKSKLYFFIQEGTVAIPAIWLVLGGCPNFSLSVHGHGHVLLDKWEEKVSNCKSDLRGRGEKK